MVLAGIVLLISFLTACSSSPATTAKSPDQYDLEKSLSIAQWQAGTIFAEVFFYPDNDVLRNFYPPTLVRTGSGFLKNPSTVIFTKHQYLLDIDGPELDSRKKIYYYFVLPQRNEIYTLNDSHVSPTKDLVYMRKIQQERSFADMLPTSAKEVPQVTELPLYEGELAKINKIYVVVNMVGVPHVKEGRLASKDEAEAMGLGDLYPRVVILDSSTMVTGESGSQVHGIAEGKLYLIGLATAVSRDYPGIVVFERIEPSDLLSP
jgi:hypothetical protein